MGIFSREKGAGRGWVVWLGGYGVDRGVVGRIWRVTGGCGAGDGHKKAGTMPGLLLPLKNY